MRFNRRLALLPTLALALALAPGCAARKPRLEPGAPLAVRVTVEDHSRQLKRLRPLTEGEKNSKEARAAALAGYRDYLDAEAGSRLTAAGIPPVTLAQGAAPDPPAPAPVVLSLNVSTLGEVRGRYLVYGIGSGVAWGVGTGLLAHNPALALGLGLYELIEESIFWIAGAGLFSRWSAPVILEATLTRPGERKPFWRRRYTVLNDRKRLRALPNAEARRRDAQLRASLARALDKLLRDLAPPGAGG